MEPASWRPSWPAARETHDAFVEQLFHHLIKQPVRAFGSRKPAELRRAFAENQFNVRKLMVEIIAEAALPAEVKPKAVPTRDTRTSSP